MDARRRDIVTGDGSPRFSVHIVRRGSGVISGEGENIELVGFEDICGDWLRREKGSKGSEGCDIAAFRRQRKPYNRAAPAGNAPLFPYGDFPRRGKFALRTAFVLISISRHSAARTSPSGGGAVGRRGAFPSPVRAVGLFSPRPPGRFACFPRAKPGCMVFFPLLP